jgi:hypothetical protein
MNLTELESRAQALFALEAYAQNMVPLPGDKTACPLLLFTQELCTGPVKTVFVEHNWANEEGNKSYTQAMNIHWVRQVYDGASDPTLRPLLCTRWSRACFERGDTVALNALVGLTKLPEMRGMVDPPAYQIAVEHWLLPLLREWQPIEVFLLGQWAYKQAFRLNGRWGNTIQHLEHNLSVKIHPIQHSSQREEWENWPENQKSLLL